ncbi:hypothetical protein B0H11DRAFT_1932982 [Mycena galericulata]|nr:hypothetical protein B0H11DRAFT_1932982 [Mycena galericulata]
MATPTTDGVRVALTMWEWTSPTPTLLVGTLIVPWTHLRCAALPQLRRTHAHDSTFMSAPPSSANASDILYKCARRLVGVNLCTATTPADKAASIVVTLRMLGVHA